MLLFLFFHFQELHELACRVVKVLDLGDLVDVPRISGVHGNHGVIDQGLKETSRIDLLSLNWSIEELHELRVNLFLLKNHGEGFHEFRLELVLVVLVEDVLNHQADGFAHILLQRVMNHVLLIEVGLQNLHAISSKEPSRYNFFHDFNAGL